ncbi:UNKNOWN [Stylonychia lemnae]|uniref:Uncharacterized protein n=1 Tax=Stylonychia lemnae TaxID=5949 RepID=A0A077ZZB4_STYLE|nr:UNKNOWN [Stylonychia lemnae]|eukprot:CDW75291.1 UNKNOWN [Stylonychia lemnae]
MNNQRERTPIKFANNNYNNIQQYEENTSSIQTPQKSITFQKQSSSQFQIGESPASPEKFYNTASEEADSGLKSGSNTLTKTMRISYFGQTGEGTPSKLMFQRNSNAGVISPKNSRSPPSRAQNENGYMSMNSVTYLQQLHAAGGVSDQMKYSSPEVKLQSSYNRTSSLKNKSIERFKPIPITIKGDQDDLREESKTLIEAQLAEKNAKLRFLLGETNKPYANYQEDLLNIKVQKSGISNNLDKQRTSQLLNQQSSNDIEVWKCSHDNDPSNTNIKNAKKGKKKRVVKNKGKVGDISFQDSDIADEFDYQYSNTYTQRQASPMSRGLSSPKQDSINKLQRREMSKTPNMRQKSLGDDEDPHPFRTGNFDQDLDEFEKYEFIRKTCKEYKNSSLNSNDQKMFQHSSSLKNRKANFVRRMNQDIERRDNRDKTFDDIKDVIAMRSDTNNSTFNRSTSPRKDRMFTAASSPARNIMNSTNKRSSINGGMSPRKLKQKDAIEIYNRLTTLESKRQYAIEMMQEAKLKDEDAEYLNSTKNRRISKKDKKNCVRRLFDDAQRRKDTHEQQKLHQLQKEQEQFKQGNSKLFSSAKKGSNNNIAIVNSNLKSQYSYKKEQQPLKQLSKQHSKQNSQSMKSDQSKSFTNVRDEYSSSSHIQFNTQSQKVLNASQNIYKQQRNNMNSNALTGAMSAEDKLELFRQQQLQISAQLYSQRSSNNQEDDDNDHNQQYEQQMIYNDDNDDTNPYLYNNDSQVSRKSLSINNQ